MSFLKKRKIKSREKEKGEADPGLYSVARIGCIGCKCFTPGEYQPMGATGGSGLKMSGKPRKCCLKREYHGCPEEEDKGYSHDIETKRRKQGWSIG